MAWSNSFPHLNSTARTASERPASPAGMGVVSQCTDENPGLFRIEVTEGPGSGVKILNQSPPGPLKESVRCAEQNLYARAKELVGDRDPRAHEFTIQFRAFDACKRLRLQEYPSCLL
jgi:ATP-dependent Lon protease